MHKVRPEIGNLYISILENVFESKEVENRSQLHSMKKELSKIENDLEEYSKARFISKEMDAELYQSLKAKLDSQKYVLKSKIEVIENAGTEFLQFQKFGVNLLTNLSEVFVKANPYQKAEIIGSIFSEKLIYENRQYRTTKINEVVNQIWQFQEGIEENKTGQVSLSDTLSCMAPRTVLVCELNF